MTGTEDKLWNLCSWHDTSERRGIWFRRTSDGSLEIRAGREGDDEHVVLRSTEVAPETIEAIENCLLVGAWMLDLNCRETSAYDDPEDDYPRQPREPCSCQRCRPYPPYPRTKGGPTT